MVTFERLESLLLETSIGELCEAWGLGAEAVLGVKKKERPMTIREVGALAELYGMKLQDILAI